MAVCYTPLTTVEVADTDEVVDTVGDRLVELQVADELPIYLAPSGQSSASSLAFGRERHTSR